MNSPTPIHRALAAGFADVMTEIDQELPVEGTIPTWLNGALVRNGTGRWDYPDDKMRHWFDGLAMLQRFSISDGTVRYRNRFLRSRNYKAVIDDGRNRYGQFATDPKRSWWEKIIDTLYFPLQFGDNNLITVLDVGPQWLAIGETPRQLVIDIDTLETFGAYEFKNFIFQMWTCSHPVRDQRRGLVYSFGMAAIPWLSRYNVWHLDMATKQRRRIATIKDAKPSYMHSFACSDNYLAFTEFPLRLNVWKFMTGAMSGSPFIENFTWDGTEGTKTTVLHKDTGKVVARVELPTMFALHHVNAFEDGGDLVFDVVAYSDSSTLDQFYLDVVLGPTGGTIPPSYLHRYRIAIDGSSKVQGPSVVSDAVIEMPTINEACTGHRNQFVYGQTFDSPGNFYNGLVKIDTHNSDPSTNFVVWSAPGCFPSEPVFTPRPGSTDEDDGVVVAEVMDANGDEAVTYLLFLDATTFTEIARARAPRALPFGLHGEFVTNVARVDQKGAAS